MVIVAGFRAALVTAAVAAAVPYGVLSCVIAAECQLWDGAVSVLMTSERRWLTAPRGRQPLCVQVGTHRQH